ncbi:MarR family winged helix-turn-helix transcriptional regulator [Roseibium polysiphoniae]|nr:MarR family transcriptional regulator [Roseibium polysiphoniae]
MFDYENIFLHWVNRLGFLSRGELTARFREAGHTVSAEEWALLIVLWEKGPQTPGDLASVTFKDRTTVTRLIDTMERKGFVTRSEDLRDRRRSIIDVSRYGAELKGSLIPIAKALLAQAIAGVSSEELETTTRTLRKITETMSATSDAGPRKKRGA